jgi:hypothetical protein
MKNLVISAALLGAVSLGGCAGVTPASISAEVATYEAEVQADANLVCGFVPTVQTIVALIPGVGGVAPAAASVAEAVCAAIAAAPAPAVQSARLKSLASPGLRVNVATVIVPGVGPVAVSGTYTR